MDEAKNLKCSWGINTDVEVIKPFEWYRYTEIHEVLPGHVKERIASRATVEVGRKFKLDHRYQW